jgi:toxin ParE1/3/4
MTKINKVIFSGKAYKDLRSLYYYIKENDSKQAANKIYHGIQKQCNELVQFPQKRHVPPELERISVYSYLEINYKPYRIIYRISEDTIIIFGVFDGRRNMTDILTKRLIGQK